MSYLGNKEIMANNIKYYMTKFDKDRNDMCRDLNIKYTTLTDWINANSYPRIDKIELMANYFNVSKSALVESYDKSIKNEGIKIPIYRQIYKGMPMGAAEEILGYEEITSQLASTGDFFALKVSDHSMEPLFIKNDIVIIRKQSTWVSDKTAIILINNNNAVIRKIKKEQRGITLIAHNTLVCDPQFYTIDEINSLPICILGVVVELKRLF